jgi:hypothetical protein
MTTMETGAVTISITNKTDRDLSPLIRTEISYYGAASSERSNYPLAAGETRRLSWTAWLTGSRPLQVDGLIATSAMTIFTVVVLPGILAGCIGWWGALRRHGSRLYGTLERKRSCRAPNPAVKPAGKEIIADGL